MPMSARAYTGLKAVVEWNPSTAQFLLDILKEASHCVKYKDDLYGPLGLILFDGVIRKPIFDNISTPINCPTFPIFYNITVLVKLPPFPQEKLADCKVFGDEWKQRKFTKGELADALERILSQLS